MPNRPMLPAATLVLALALLAPGCGKQSQSIFRLLNQRPTVELTAAPVGVADTAWYAYEIQWSGHDPDGHVERFEYVIDPPTVPGADTTWIATTRNHEQFHFRATEAYWDPVHGWRSNGFHVFAIRAVDDRGAVSAVVSRAFYSYTIAPTVRITLPTPNIFLARLVPLGAPIVWEGEDDDGIASKRPVLYRYRLFRQNDPAPEFDFGLALMQPDSLRSFYAARNFAGWDSVGGDTTSARFGSLEPNVQYLLVVVAVDEAGAYSPAFSLETNMLRFTIAPPGTLGPILTIWTDYVRYSYTDGGVSQDPLRWINFEVPAGVRIKIHWTAQAVEGTQVAWSRWWLDGGAPSPQDTTTTCEIGPFAGGEEHFFYIEVHDTWGLSSLAILHIHVVAPSFEHELLIVDDTRMRPDQFGANGVPLTYGNTPWPAAAELDTFLYARGGLPWRGPQGIAGDLPLSKPGVFSGYGFDTLGTRQGFEIASSGVPLSLLGRYRHVLWLTDATGASTTYPPDSPVDPIATLRWMSAAGRMNTLAAYASMGGEVWLAGGTALTCTLLPWNAVGAQNNDDVYGPGFVVFSANQGEISAPSLAWNFAHWRSEFVSARAATLPRRSTAAVGGWSNPGWNGSGTISAPDYSRLPPLLRRRALALGDSLPPTRTVASAYYSTAVNPTVEYLTQPNAILEDMDPDPAVTDTRAALDTLYELQGGALATATTGQRPATMTYYHGVEAPRFVMTGFDLWTWSRQDVVGLVDFVLHDVWGMNRAAAPAPRPVPATGSRGAPAPARPGAARLPVPAGGARR